MKRAPIRSSLFNLAFFAATAVLCVAYIPLLVLPRRVFTAAVGFWIGVVTFLEYTLLGLRYEIRGREHLPESGPFLVAAKHQSPYETFKLRFLVKDPAIVLKKELLRIPLWGSYLKKSDVIAIDRSTPEKALRSLEDGALRMKVQGRPIVIFPQGTRVKPDETPAQKPYKAGIARVQEATGLPVIPLALNSGLFWPRTGWLKSPGTVIFEFLEPIAPGLERRALMKELEEKIEGATRSLMNEAREKELDAPAIPGAWIGLTVLAVLLIGFYTALWFETAERIQKGYVETVSGITSVQNPHVPEVSGFPGPIVLFVPEEFFQTNKGSLKIEGLKATGWPIPLLPVRVETGPVTVNSYKWPLPVVLDSVTSHLRYHNDIVHILDSEIRQGDFLGGVTGTVDLTQEPLPKFDLKVSLKNHTALLVALTQSGALDPRTALFMGAGLGALSDADGVVRVPITQDGPTLYAGPLPVASLPVSPRPELYNPPDPDQ